MMLLWWLIMDDNGSWSDWWLSHPSEKIWVRQFGLLFPIYGKINKTCSEPTRNSRRQYQDYRQIPTYLHISWISPESGKSRNWSVNIRTPFWLPHWEDGHIPIGMCAYTLSKNAQKMILIVIKYTWFPECDSLPYGLLFTDTAKNHTLLVKPSNWNLMQGGNNPYVGNCELSGIATKCKFPNTGLPPNHPF